MKTNTPPDFKRFVFIQNEKRNDIFDLQTEPDPRLFTYFRLSEPRTPFLIKQGARYVLESWNKGKKVGFTGLIPVGTPNYYFGDIVAKNAKGKAKNSLLIVHLNEQTATLYYFPSFNVFPSLRMGFCQQFIRTIGMKKGTDTPTSPLSNQYNPEGK